MEDLVAVLTHALSKGHVPMIALKSGTVIRLWDAAPLRAALCSSTASADYTMLAPNGMSWTNPVDGTWSVPRLCADAQLKVRCVIMCMRLTRRRIAFGCVSGARPVISKIMSWHT